MHILAQIREGIRIATVVLHCHIKDKCRLSVFFVLIGIDNMLHICIIADIFTHISLIRVIINKIQMFKPNQRIYFLPVPSGSVVRMLRVSLISEACQIARQGWRILCNILLIRNTSARQKRHRIACQKLKLRVCRIAAAHRYLCITGDCIIRALLHLMHKRHVIFVGLEISDNRQIRECFVHDYNDIRKVFVIRILPPVL